MSQQPKKLTDERSRRTARGIRDRQWRWMERMADCDPLWFCVWNKLRKPELDDEWRDGLMSGLELLAWSDAHPDWFVLGEWDDGRYALPMRLSDAGRDALSNRHLYDSEAEVAA